LRVLGAGVDCSKRWLFAWVRLAVVTLLAFSVVSAAPAAADPNVGYDISYPQCNGSFPSGGAFGVVGVNGGRPYGANPCLGTGDGPSELSWAGMNAQLYANTADPGPALSSHWPNGQSSPKQCNTATNPGSDTPECHYDYGWNAAADSYQDAVNAYVSLGWAASGATRTPVANQWWLDVETANSWTSTPSLNVQALQGEVDYLKSVAAAGVGFYSSASDWQAITAGTTSFAFFASWLAGASSLSDAQSRCGSSGFTGGGVTLVQYPSGGFDADYRCTAQPALSFVTAAQTLTAGASSGAISVQLSQPASTSVTISLASSSTAGSFATGATGPWSASLSLSVAAGAGSSASFYYQDTKAGAPTLTATATGYADATQTETVNAAALATVSVSPNSAQLRMGTSKTFSAAGSDSYGNPVPVTPTWSVSPPLGTFSPNPASTTSFSATTVGTGTITATAAGISGTASISVLAKRRHSATATKNLTRAGARRGRSGSRTRPSLRVSPIVVAPGGRVRVFGNAGGCPRGDTVFILSRALAGRSFAGLGAITTRVRAHGTFSASGYTRRNARAGSYTITARCGGGNLGVTAHLHLT
jgi:hypothetical protein